MGVTFSRCSATHWCQHQTGGKGRPMTTSNVMSTAASPLFRPTFTCRRGTAFGAGAVLFALTACAPSDMEQEAEFADGEPETSAQPPATTAEDADEEDAVSESDNADEDDDAGASDDEAEADGADQEGEDQSDLEEPDRDLSEPVVVEETVWDFANEQGVDVEVTVYPFMRDSFQGEELMSGNITYEVTSEEGEYALHEYGTDPREVRLFDPADPEFLSYPVWAASDSDSDMMAGVESNTASAGEDAIRWSGIYTDPGSDSTAVLLPYVGLAEDVGIVERSEVAPQDYFTLSQTGEAIQEISSAQSPLDMYRERAGGSLNIREEDGQTVITLDAEILFDSDEYTVRDDAADALQSAANELERAAGGELRIVGHTDSVDTEEYNQTLSENRAESVQQGLDELVDLEEFDEVTTEGRSLREPIATNETEEGRQLNRRVELYFTPPELDEEEIEEAGTDSGDLPATQGPEAEGDEPITITAADGRASEVQVESLRRIGDVLVGRISVEVTDLPEDAADTGSLAWPFSFGNTGAREDHDHDFNPGTQADALTLLLGDQRIFPLEYSGEGYLDLGDDGEVIEEDHPWHMPLADRGFGYRAPAEVGTRATATVIWPDVPGDTVTIDVPGETEHAHRPYSEPFRFVEVPVEDEG